MKLTALSALAVYVAWQAINTGILLVAFRTTTSRELTYRQVLPGAVAGAAVVSLAHDPARLIAGGRLVARDQPHREQRVAQRPAAAARHRQRRSRGQRWQGLCDRR